jgi:hypothetical protein
MVQHECFKLVNQDLEKYNTVLVTDLLQANRIFVATERIKNLRDGKRAKQVIATYCPFCGVRLDDQ